jgi:hypothetical protein
MGHDAARSGEVRIVGERRKKKKRGGGGDEGRK